MTDEYLYPPDNQNQKLEIPQIACPIEEKLWLFGCSVGGNFPAVLRK